MIPVMKHSFRFFSQLSFRRKLTAALLTVSFFIAVFLSFASYKLSSNVIYNMSLRLSENNVSIVQNQLEDYFEAAQNYLTRIIRLPVIRDTIDQKSLTEAQKNDLEIQLNSSIKEILYSGTTSNDITFRIINIYLKNGFSYSYVPSNSLKYNDYTSSRAYFTENNFLPKDNYSPGTWCEYILEKDNFGAVNGSILGVRLLYDGTTMEELGMIVFAIDEAKLYSLYSGFSDKATLMNMNGQVISGADKSALGLDMKDIQLKNKILQSSLSTNSISFQSGNKTHIVSFKRLAGNNIFFILPFDYYDTLKQKEIVSFTIFSVIIALAGMITATLFAFIFSGELSSSILSLKTVVQKASEGDLNARFTSENKDEIAYLGEKFNEMFDNINKLFEIQHQDSKTKQNLELRLMQSQINPHLLYNTLDSVLWAMKNSDTSKASELIVSLSEFFKITLSGGSSLITLNSEINMINNYINIQRLARGKNIQLNISIPEELKEHKVIKLTLQPIVENAIIHGFSGYRDDGTIEIGARIEGKDLYIGVTDNGIGVMPDELEVLNNVLNTYPPQPGQKHFGLYNVNHRIKRTFGNDYGILIDSEVGDFTAVTLHLPFCGANENENNSKLIENNGEKYYV